MSELQRGKEPSAIVRQRVVKAVGVTAASALLAFTAACGGEAESAPEPVGASSEPSSPSSTPTVTETPSPTPTERPLSRFEDEPQVVVAREWAAAMARAVNEKDRALKGPARYMTAAGRERYRGYVEPDMGLYYPGPMPFTPTDVTVNGRRAEISICWWARGFAQDPKTKRPADKRKIEPGTMFLKKQGGRWKLDDQLLAQGDCSQVPVKGVAW
ncbi:MAG: hypothetical protein ACOYX5_17870 [Actinomycetota bacterium]